MRKYYLLVLFLAVSVRGKSISDEEYEAAVTKYKDITKNEPRYNFPTDMKAFDGRELHFGIKLEGQSWSLNVDKDPIKFMSPYEFNRAIRDILVGGVLYWATLEDHCNKKGPQKTIDGKWLHVRPEVCRAVLGLMRVEYKVEYPWAQLRYDFTILDKHYAQTVAARKLIIPHVFLTDFLFDIIPIEVKKYKERQKTYNYKTDFHIDWRVEAERLDTHKWLFINLTNSIEINQNVIKSIEEKYKTALDNYKTHITGVNVAQQPQMLNWESEKGATQEQKPDLKYITERQFSNSIKTVLTKKKRFFGLGGYIFTFDALLKSKTEKTLNHTMAQIFAEIVGVEWDKGAPKIREFKQPKANEMAIKLYAFFGSHLKVELEKNEKKPGELKTKILKKREGIVHVGGFEREHYETFWDTEIRGDEEAIKAYEKAQKRVDELKDLFVDVEKSISELKSQNGKSKVTVNQTVTVKKSHRFTEILRIRKQKN